MSTDVNLDTIAPGDVVVVSRRPFPGTRMTIFQRWHTAQNGTRWLIVRDAATRPEIAVPPKDVISFSKPGTAEMQTEELGKGEG